MPAVAVNSWDLIDKTVGTVGGGRIGYHMMKRLRVGESHPLPQPLPPSPLPLLNNTCICLRVGSCARNCSMNIEAYGRELCFQGLQELVVTPAFTD